MRLGATLASLSPGPQRPLAEWAKRLVGAGFESLWTPQVVGRGGLVPDPFVALAVAATAMHRYADAGFDDAVVLIGPAGPDPERVRALFG